MSGFRLLILGVGDAFSARYYSSCVALEAEGQWLLLDCPHPIRKMMAEAATSSGVAVDVGQISAVALTHLHADHSSGLEGFGLYSRYILGQKAKLLAHPSVSEHLWAGHLAGSLGVPQRGDAPQPVRTLEDFFDLQMLTETGPTQVGAFRIECRPTIHSIPTTAFRIAAGGRSLGFSADTAFDPALIDWLAQADLIVHETNPGFLHTPYEKLAALPADLRARMRLIHYPDNFDLQTGSIEPLRQGCCYTV